MDIKETKEIERLFTLKEMKDCFNAAREERAWCGMGGWKRANKYETFKEYLSIKLNKSSKKIK